MTHSDLDRKIDNKISAAAQRALKEAEKRREQADLDAQDLSVEIKGRKGPEPVRYGDWEKNGIISDF